MTRAHSPATTALESHFVASEIPQDLQRIQESDINLSLWQRSALPNVARELSALRANDLPDVRCWTSVHTFDEDIHLLLTECHLNPGAFRNWITDMRYLVEQFLTVSNGRDITLRLETIEDDGCTRFHVDYTNLRLLCTYRGPGTEWLRNDQVDRNAHQDFDTNEQIIRHGEPLQFKPFWVGILKGDAYPGNSGHGLVHRSPPISSTGQTRVLFCLDC